ncbi:uncharacterized protein LOC123555830 [Mercenaria mercenaria]|uniref:uncharacterized protein LOC123555830 n=1 Tax=Mercenaria mercenaria TaxID=6596 RepID=UPI00234FA34B|nr:uncharacterized protein LOC123555830 [Mercenaria mercenaria]
MCGSQANRVSKVTVTKRSVIPPASLTHVPCSGEDLQQDFFIEARPGLKVMIARTLHQGGDHPSLAVINMSNNFQVLKRGQWVATAQDPLEISPEVEGVRGEASARVNRVAKGPPEQTQVPEHLRVILDRKYEHLTDEQTADLKSLLIEFQDVFAKDDLDLGHFREIEHAIDTGHARPVKARMRRTPVGFAAEEEAHLHKMLAAGVIRPSISEWASPPRVNSEERQYG